MFNRYKKELINREKSLILKEVEAWKIEQMLNARKEVEDFRDKCKNEINDLALACVNDTKSYEHTYHHNMEKLGIEIAKLEAKKEALVEITNQDKVVYNKMVEHKDTEIKRLTDIIQKIIDKNPAPITINNNK